MFGYSREEIHDIVDPLTMIHPDSRSEFATVCQGYQK